MGMTARDLLRRKGTPYDDLGLGDTKWTDDQLIDLMLVHPILIERPVVIVGDRAVIARPPERLLDLVGG